jgi:hypothetical protein
MVIAGTRSILLKSEVIFDPCPNCHKTNCVKMSVYQLYGALFFIIFFPSNKIGISNCTNCGHELKLYQMPPSYQLHYQNLKANTKTPIWTFSGILVILLVIVAFFVIVHQQDVETKKYILSPRKNDIYQVQVKNNWYSLYKVKTVVGDTVFFISNKYQVDQISGLDELDTSAYDQSVTYAFPKSKLLKMKENGWILQVDRK